MKMSYTILALAFYCLFNFEVRSQLNIPGADGSDGAFAPTSNYVVDLERATVGAWDLNNSTNAGNGVYDPAKWAVVFKYSSVRIPAGVTVTFKNHRSRAPVVWLVSSNATIAGSVSLNGQGSAPSQTTQTEPGPGGFRGSYANQAGIIGTAGFGPGGGGTYLSPGRYPGVYGNQHIIPLIGGSGGSSSEFFGNPTPGGGGGGAILIAAAEILSLSGSIQANGGIGPGQFRGNGSGGAIRLIAKHISGSGIVRTSGSGDEGRIRIESKSSDGILNLSPLTAIVEPENPVTIWAQEDWPAVRIISAGGLGVASDPTASLNPPGADVQFNTNGAVQVVIEARNLATNAVLTVRVAPAVGNAWFVNATRTSGDSILSYWMATLALPVNNYAAIQVRATSP